MILLANGNDRKLTQRAIPKLHNWDDFKTWNYDSKQPSWLEWNWSRVESHAKRFWVERSNKYYQSKILLQTIRWWNATLSSFYNCTVLHAHWFTNTK